jgi:HEAT repeats
MKFGDVPDLLFTIPIALASKGNQRHRGVERWIAITTALLTTCLLLGTAHAAGYQEARADTGQLQLADSPALRVEFKGGLLSIEARQSPWTEVLKAVREETGMRVHSSLPPAGLVTVSCTALPVKQALERLFGLEANFMFRYPKRKTWPLAVPQEVWVLGTAQRGDAKPPRQASDEDQTVQSAKASENLHPAKTDSTSDNAASEGGGLDLNDDAEALDRLIEQARNEDPETRAQALSTLAGGGHADEDAVASVLDAALADKDPNVRGIAVQALVNRRGADAIEHLQQALADPDSSVRIIAVENAIQQEQGRELLQEALADADDLVRTIAEDRLKQMAE